MTLYECLHCKKTNATFGTNRAKCIFCQTRNNLGHLKILGYTTKVQAIKNGLVNSPKFLEKFVKNKYCSKKELKEEGL